MDGIVEDWDMPVGSQFSRKKMFGMKGHATLMVRGKVGCANGLLCKNCTEACDGKRLTQTSAMLIMKIPRVVLTSI